MSSKPHLAALALVLSCGGLGGCQAPVGPAGQARIVIELPPHTGGVHPQVRWAPLDTDTTVREATLAMWPEVFGVWERDRAESYVQMIRWVEVNDPDRGWHYTVNGEARAEGPQDRVLADGDVVVWRYL